MEFLSKHPRLAPVLQEARREVFRYFPESTLSLEAIIDPDTETHERLLLSIGTHLAPAEAFARLRQLDQGWWLEALGRTDGAVCLTLEFQ